MGTVANSTSTMHTIHKKPITFESFETSDYNENLPMITPTVLGIGTDYLIDDLEQLRLLYIQHSKDAEEATDPKEKEKSAKKAKQYWKELVRWLPESWLQTRTVTMSYENLLTMCSSGQRRFHKLSEWSGDKTKHIDNFIDFARQLPYAQELIFTDELK